jgi:GNAT superfamily N-acetyltransferase
MTQSDPQGRELVLYVDRFDWDRWAPHLRPRTDDVRILCLADEAVDSSAPIVGALFDLALQVHVKPDWTLEQHLTRFDSWERVYLAMLGAQCVGYTYARATDVAGLLQQGMTAVLPEHRRQGIGLALKLATIRHARQHSLNRIQTSNSSSRDAMIQLNLKLGYVDQ